MEIEILKSKKEVYPLEDINLRQTQEIKTKKTIVKILRKNFKENLLLLLTIASVALGVALGFILRAYTDFSPPVKKYFGFPGEIFIRSFKFVILPLISSSLISGIAGLRASVSGKIAARSIVFYLSSTFSAVVVGLILVSTIKPGYLNKSNDIRVGNDPLANRKVNTVDTLFDLVRNLIPENMVEMTFELYQSEIVPKYQQVNNSNHSNATVLLYYEALPNHRKGLNVLGVVVFSILLGFVLAQMGEKGKILIQFFEAINEASLRIIHLIIWISPFGICSLISAVILEMNNPVETFKSISYYVMTVLIGLAIQGVIVLPGIYMIITRRNPLTYAKNMVEALVVALATSSSAATLPITFRCIEEKNKIPKIISRFVLPIGASINLDGTALYEAVASIFIAQMNGIELRFVDLVVTSITASLASIGASGIPSAGLITMVIVLSALNIPQQQISLIYAVDWFLDRFRTMINVWGDAIATGCIAELSKKEISEHKLYTEAQDNKTFKNDEIVKTNNINQEILI